MPVRAWALALGPSLASVAWAVALAFPRPLLRAAATVEALETAMEMVLV